MMGNTESGLPWRLLDQRERFEAVPGELALPDPFGDGDAVAVSVVTPVSPPTPRKSPSRQRYPPRSQLSPGGRMRRRLSSVERAGSSGPLEARVPLRPISASSSPPRSPIRRASRMATASRESARVVLPLALATR